MESRDEEYQNVQDNATRFSLFTFVGASASGLFFLFLRCVPARRTCLGAGTDALGCHCDREIAMIPESIHPLTCFQAGASCATWRGIVRWRYGSSYRSVSVVRKQTPVPGAFAVAIRHGDFLRQRGSAAEEQ
ncbi:hypothetical protein MRX96_045065 [Rhipicephalus microplus]